MTQFTKLSRIALPLLAVAFVAACSDNSTDEQQAEPTEAQGGAALPDAPLPDAATPAAAIPGREFRYTSLDGCPLLRSAPEEAGFYEYECPGEGGYRLKLTEADLRQNIHVIPPGGGAERSLDLNALSGGGFSELADNVEWRGTLDGTAFKPDALILRQEAIEDPDGKKEVSYLVAVKLTAKPCAVARIAPGPGQNEKARAAADGAGPCLPGTG